MVDELRFSPSAGCMLCSNGLSRAQIKYLVSKSTLVRINTLSRYCIADSPLSTVRKRPSPCGFHRREADCETAIDPRGCTARSPPQAAQECSLPQARLCRQYQDQHCWHAAKVEEAKKPFSLAQLAMSLTDMEILHIRQAGTEWRWISSSICVKHPGLSPGAHRGSIFANTNSYTLVPLAVTWTGTTAEKFSRYVSPGRLYTSVVAGSLQVA